MADLPMLNAIEDGFRDQTNAFKDSVSRLQRSIRTGLALNRKEIVNLNETIMKAFNVNEDMLALEKERMRIENERWLEAQRQKKTEESENKTKKKDDGLGLLGIAGIIGGIASAISAFTTALGAALITEGIKYQNMFNRMFMNAFRPVGALFTRLTTLMGERLFPNVMTRLRSFVAGLSMQFTLLGETATKTFGGVREFFSSTFQSFVERLRNFANMLTNNGQLIDDIKAVFNTAMDKIRSFFRFVFGPIASAIDDVRKVADSAEDGIGIIQRVKNAVQAFFTPFRTAISMFEPVIKIVRGLGTAIGRFFFPLAIIMGAFEVISETIEGFQEGGIMEGLKRGFTALLDVTVFLIPNMLKDLVSWVAGAFGFEEIEKALDSMSIGEYLMDILTTIVDGITGGITSMISGVTDFFGGLFGDDEDDDTKQKLEELKNKQKEKQAEINAARARKEQERIKALEAEKAEIETPVSEGKTLAEIQAEKREIDSKLYQLNREKLLAQKYGDTEGFEAARDESLRLVDRRRSLSGAEIDARSRSVERQQSAPVVVTDASTKTTTNTNNTPVTVATASPYRQRPSPQNRGSRFNGLPISA